MILAMSRDFATISRSAQAAPRTTRKGTARAADARLRGDPGFADYGIDESPFYLIARTAGRYAMDMEDALRSIDMDLPSWRALMLVHEVNPSSVNEITDRAVMRLSTMTRVVQRLEKRGLVKLDDPPGRRARDRSVHHCAGRAAP